MQTDSTSIEKLVNENYQTMNLMWLRDADVLSTLIDKFNSISLKSQIQLMELFIRVLDYYRAAKERKKSPKSTPQRQLTYAQMLQSSKNLQSEPPDFYISNNTETDTIMSFLERRLPQENNKNLVSFFHVFVHVSISGILEEGIGPIMRRIRDLDAKLQSNPTYTNLEYSPPLK